MGARALVREEDAKARRAALLDPSPLVRREAARAASFARDGGDLSLLVETARLDPDWRVRTDAVRALAHQPGDPEVANRLRDLWDSSDDDAREDIATALAEPEVFAHGGRDALILIVAREHGPGATEAASIAARLYAKDPDLGPPAFAHLELAVSEGAKRERLHALAALPLTDKGARDAVKKAEEDGDEEVKVAALTRMTEIPEGAAEATKALEEIAKNNEDPLAARAKFALAAAKDAQVVPLLDADLASKDAETRLAAATAFAGMGETRRAARELADADASVRARVACTLMMAARGH